MNSGRNPDAKKRDLFFSFYYLVNKRGDFHLDRAIDASLAIRNKIELLPQRNGYAPKVSIGVNCGEMVAGNIGSASLTCLDYTDIGDAVNIAQRLQSAAGHSQVQITAGLL